MVASSRPQHLILPLAPLAGGIAGLIVAALFFVVPHDLLDTLAVESGVAALLSAAEPPLGFNARLLLALGCGGGVALVVWFGLFLLVGTRTVVVQRGRGGGDAPVLRRADAHPDAPSRRPLFANTDLGTPFLEVRATAVHLEADSVAAPIVAPPAPLVPAMPEERPLPADLDQPLSVYDPAAVPEAPLDWFPPPASLVPRRQTFEPGERLETFPLTPPTVAAPAPTVPATASAPAQDRVATRNPSQAIHDLLDRLERVAASRMPAPAPPETIENTLATLRKMATGGR